MRHPQPTSRSGRGERREPERPLRPSGVKRLNQAVERWDAVEPRLQSVLEIVSTGAVGWAWLIVTRFAGCGAVSPRRRARQRPTDCRASVLGVGSIVPTVHLKRALGHIVYNPSWVQR